MRYPHVNDIFNLNCILQKAKAVRYTVCFRLHYLEIRYDQVIHTRERAYNLGCWDSACTGVLCLHLSGLYSGTSFYMLEVFQPARSAD